MSGENDLPHSDYLWDRTGPVDLQVERLEQLLAANGLDVVRIPALRRNALPSPRSTRHWRILLASAAMLAGLALGMRIWYQHRLQWPDAQPWQIASVRGDVRIDGRPAESAVELAPGQILETGSDASVSLRVARIGQVVVGANSRFTLELTQSGRHRTRLQRGSLWARVWAPPGALGVYTPLGDVLDLGCEFVLQIRTQGNGSLTVRSGWVEINDGWREVLVPQGARVEFSARNGPGTPYDLGARNAFVAALHELDAREGTLSAQDPAVRKLVAAARPQDAVTLLSLLSRHPELADGPLFEHTARTMPTGADVSRRAVRAHELDALDPWWHSLPYPRIKHWWMQWPDAFGLEKTDPAPATGARQKNP